ncbi:hypothetical protein EDB83DRAFT_2320140 [Lactarius deliciosus]|nr:hypothetical protein EDB83DRAFT_2320140 [Lactarius deliciosus]
MASSSSIIRALSPSLANIAQHTASDPVDALNARHFALSGANTVDELLELIPSDYRILSATPTSCASSRATLAKWKHHASVGTLPAHLKGSAPKVQFTSGYKDADEAKAHSALLAASHEEYQKKVLAESIKAKADEVTFMEAAITPQRLWSDLASHIAPRSVTVIAGSKLPVVETAVDGTQSVTAWEPSPTAIAIRDNLMVDCAVFALRVISLVEARDAALSRKIEKKRAVAAAATTAAADTDMVVDGVTSNTIAAVVRKEVQRAFMGLAAKEKGGKGKGKNLMEITKKQAQKVMAKYQEGPKKYLPYPPYHRSLSHAVRRPQGSEGMGQRKKKRSGKGKGKAGGSGGQQQQKKQQQPQQKQKSAKAKGKERAQ